MNKDEIFAKRLLEIMLMCAEDGTDNCDLSFEVGGYEISCNITFDNPKKIGE